MKRAIIFFLLIQSTYFSIADCTHYISVFPNTKQIQSHALFMIEESASIIITKELGTTFPIYLTAEKDTVTLEILTKNISKNESVQILLQPTRPLKINQTYTLHVDHIPERYQHYFKEWDKQTDEKVAISWNIVEGDDQSVAHWSKSPQLEEMKVSYGCGTMANVVFDFKIDDKEELFIIVEVTEVETKEKQLFFQPRYYYKETKINIGESSCASNFVYAANQQYKVRFSLMDIYGNTYKKWTKPIVFDSPWGEMKDIRY